MKYTFFIGSLYGGGAERVVCNLANYFVEKGNICSVLTMSDVTKSYQLNPNIYIETLISDSEKKNYIVDHCLRLFRLYQYVKSCSCDCYVVFLPVPIIFLLFMRNFIGAKIIASERCDPSRLSYFLKVILKKLAGKADGWVFQTEEAKAWYGNCVKKSIVISNPVSEKFICSIYSGDRKKVIVSAGRLTEQKRFDLLIDSFAKIHQIYEDYMLIIYGEGPLRKNLEDQVKKLGLADYVKLPGNVTDLADRIRDASLFVMTSDFEGMPNALMEAMSLGLPCISTDCPVGGPRFLIQNGENGLLVPLGNEAALTKFIDKILSNREYAKELGQKAHEIVNRLAPNEIYEQWENFIKTV